MAFTDLMMTGGPERARVFLAGPGQETVVYQLMPPFQADQRFFVSGFAHTWDILTISLPQQKPELLVINAGLAPGIDGLKSLLASLQAWNGTALVLLPAQLANSRGVLEAMPGVVGSLLELPVSWADLPSLAFSVAQTARARLSQIAPNSSGTSRPGLLPEHGGLGYASGMSATLTGTKRIAVWSQAGGAGTSTIAESLAYELAARLSVRTLLFSLGLPPAAPAHFKLRYVPNLGEFFDRPGKPAIQAAVQRFEGLDVLVAPEVSREYMNAAAAGGQDRREANSIYSMFLAADDGAYAAMVMDTPAAEGYGWQAFSLMFANTILLVARPTLADLFVTRHTLNLLTSGLGDHQFARESVYLVLNQASPAGSLTLRQFQEELVNNVGWAPQVLTVIDHDPAVLAAQEQRVPVTLRADKFARGIRQILGTLLPGMERLAPVESGQSSGRSLLKLPKLKFG